MEKVVRSVPGPYMFIVDITYTMGNYHVVHTEGSSHNFLLTYFLSDTAVTDGNKVPSRTDTMNATVNVSDSQAQLLMKQSIHFSVTGYVHVDFTACLNTHFACLYLMTKNGSYNEISPADNVHCIDFDLHKICAPGNILKNFGMICKHL